MMPDACIGDYRMTYCLVATMSQWYSWQQSDWSEVLANEWGMKLVGV